MKDYTILTERLGLRNWAEEDIVPFAKINADPEVMRYFPNTMTFEETESAVSRIQKLIDEYTDGFFAADLRETNEFIGFIGLGRPRFISYFTPCIEIGWRLDKRYWNKGLATEGARACLHFGFETIGATEIYSFTALQNKPSERVMQKIGMKKSGTFDHPFVESSSGLKKHVLYHIIAP